MPADLIFIGIGPVVVGIVDNIGRKPQNTLLDRFQHDHRVVRQPPHRQRQPTQREGVQGVAARVQDDERDRERQRDGDRHDQRAAQALKKKQDDEKKESS